MKSELRILTSEVRADSSGRISGYSAVFNQWSEDLGGFREKIAPGAFARSLRTQDTVALFNHNTSAVLGRKSAGTLRMHEDTTGLFFTVDMPATSVGRDVLELVRRGDIRQCSFGFVTRSDEWASRGSERTLLDVDLNDVGPVTFPAYPQTSVGARSEIGKNERVGWYKFERPSDSKLFRPASQVDDMAETRRCRDHSRLVRLELQDDL